ncbi:MAG: hypothetical protein HG424_001020 [candidate division SR1 bacterium]|nr:hypothetical protein [candidate division SR1 bacterium]
MLQQKRACRRSKSRYVRSLAGAKRRQKTAHLRPRGESLGGRRLKAYADAESDFLSNDTFIAMLTNILRERIHNKQEIIDTLQKDKQSIRAYTSRWNWDAECLPAIQRCNKQIKLLQKDIERLERWISWLERIGL